MTHGRLMTLAALAALGIPWPAASSGQTVRGVVVDPTGAPVPGVVVLMIDAGSNAAARAPTNERGDYRVATPRPGTYRLHTLRIGFRPVSSEPISLASGQEVTQRIVLTGIPTALGAVRVVGRSSCGSMGDPSAATFAAWDQARTALTATQLTASARAVTATTVTYERTMDPGFRQVLQQSADVHSGFVTQPWRSLPPQAVRRIGYITTDHDGTTTYSAPGLDVLLSNAFFEDHCFRIAKGSDKRRIGVAFEPAPEREVKRDIAEIRGTLWLDRTSSELRSIDFRYVNVTAEQEANAGGGMSSCGWWTERGPCRDGTSGCPRWSNRSARESWAGRRPASPPSRSWVESLRSPCGGATRCGRARRSCYRALCSTRRPARQWQVPA